MQDISVVNSLLTIVRRYPVLRLPVRTVRECSVAALALRNRIRAIVRGGFRTNQNAEYHQSIPRFDAPSNNFADAQEFCRWLEAQGIRYATGSHAIYLPPQAGLENVLGEIVHHYPSDCGFKILRDFAPPQTAHYIVDARSRPVTRYLMGSVQQQVLAAGALQTFGLGPVCYGLAHIKLGPHDATAFVVKHVEGESPTLQDYNRFLQKLSHVQKLGIIDLVPRGKLTDTDFVPPDCNGNLIRESAGGALHYVDFQRFIPRPHTLLKEIARESVESVHFGGSSKLLRGGKKYLYQSIPSLSDAGKRDTVYRWNQFQELFEQHGIRVQDKLVLDVCCNSGMMLAQALRAGAHWGIGWDLPQVTNKSEKILSALGATRTTLISAELGPDYPIANSVPDWLQRLWGESVVFYLAAIEHVGIIEDLAQVPWRALLFEGHQGDGKRMVNDQLKQMESAWNCRIVHQGSISDGDCGTRPVALLVRD